MANVFVEGPTVIGEDNVFYPVLHRRGRAAGPEVPGRALGDTHRRPEQIREFVTIHRGTEGGGLVTSIGDDNLLMAYVHIAHDVHVGNRTVLGERRHVRRACRDRRLGGDRRFHRGCTSSAASDGTR